MAVRPYSGQHVGHQMSTGLGRAFGGFHRMGKVRGIYSHMQGRPEHRVSDMCAQGLCRVGAVGGRLGVGAGFKLLLKDRRERTVSFHLKIDTQQGRRT